MAISYETAEEKKRGTDYATEVETIVVRDGVLQQEMEDQIMLRILVVDDEEILRMLMKLVFEAHGYEVILAGCGEDALSLLQQESFDAVITDLQMGEVNGFDVVRYARNCSENSVIFMYTSCHEKEYEDTAKTMGVDKYIRKPASIEMLLNLLAEHLLQRVLGRNQFSCAAHG